MVSERNRAQLDIGKRYEEIAGYLFDILAENYLSGHSQTAVDSYRLILDNECRSAQYRIGPAKASAIKSIREEYLRGGGIR